MLLTCATIASCDDFDDIVAWGEHHLDFLRMFAPFHNAIPCERWLRTLVNRVDPLTFGFCFESWIHALWPGRHDLIAIDGKTSRRTHHKRKGLKALHTLSAYATNARLTLAQLSVPEKANEITAIPDLLDHLAERERLEGALVTIDAMGCQVDIAAKIVEHKADFLLPLKGNQPTMQAEVGSYFETAPADKLVKKTTVEKGHGRIETRVFTASKEVDWIESENLTRDNPASKASRRFFTFSIAANTRTDAPSIRGSTFAPRSSTSNASPAARADIGAWKACTGCSTSSSRMTCRATEPETEPRTWP